MDGRFQRLFIGVPRASPADLPGLPGIGQVGRGAHGLSSRREPNSRLARFRCSMRIRCRRSKVQMRVLVAGASGAIGRTLVPALLARGHQVAGFVRSEEGGAWVANQGAEPLIADALDASAVMACFERSRPEA